MRWLIKLKYYCHGPVTLHVYVFVFVSLTFFLASLLTTRCLGGPNHGLPVAVLTPASNFSPEVHHPVYQPLLKAVAWSPLSLDYCVTFVSAILALEIFWFLFVLCLAFNILSLYIDFPCPALRPCSWVWQLQWACGAPHPPWTSGFAGPLLPTCI